MQTSEEALTLTVSGCACITAELKQTGFRADRIVGSNSALRSIVEIYQAKFFVAWRKALNLDLFVLL